MQLIATWQVFFAKFYPSMPVFVIVVYTIILTFNQFQEFFPRFGILSENIYHAACNRNCVDFLDTAHQHAHMTGGPICFYSNYFLLLQTTFA